MTKTFERFLRSFTDQELTAFVYERDQVRPPYWKAMQLALRIELDRRGLRLEDDAGASLSPTHADARARSVTA